MMPAADVGAGLEGRLKPADKKKLSESVPIIAAPQCRQRIALGFGVPATDNGWAAIRHNRHSLRYDFFAA
jgi:hypothetical protein